MKSDSLNKTPVIFIISMLFQMVIISGMSISETGIMTNPEPGMVKNIKNQPEIEIAPGAKGRIFWGKGCLINRMRLNSGAMIPRETLPAERIMIVMKGTVDQLINGSFVKMAAHEYEPMTPISGRRGRRDFVYLERGAENELRAGKEGAEIIEVYSPVRLDYIGKMGLPEQAAHKRDNAPSMPPSVEPNKVYDYYDVQFTRTFPGGFSRLIAGKNVQLSFLRMDPGASFENSTHPEEQIMIVLRGWRNETIMGSTVKMTAGDIVCIPSGVVHGGAMGPEGCDVLDVFWPVRSGFRKKMITMLDKYHSIIPGDADIELVVDGGSEGPGLCYVEGPSWLNGKLYFSSMHYDARWNGDPKKSAFVEMDPDGSYRYLSYGEMETNGTFPMENGNLAVCDMYGHRVVEMDTKGHVVRILADRCEGKRLDGPNDIVVDNRGGIYFTDPQILPGPYMQPGRSVMYRKPSGEVIRVVEPGVLIKPNGLILSPDCETLYVNSTHENFMMAYDVNEDGSLSNGRKFGRLLITPEELDRRSINIQADGMTVDERGNIYITTILGLQIFSPEGNNIGYIHFPQMPVNCCFGDDDGKTLYVTCNDKIYKIRTNFRGAAYTLK